jgi:5'(3')-deoxyribonucleotidase
VRIGIDLDGVVANFTLGWVTRYNAEHGTTLTEADVTAWGGMLVLTHFADMEQFWHWVANGEGPSLFRSLPAYPGAVEAMQRLARNHEIVILTTKPAFAVTDTEEWLAENHVPHHELHITEEKWRIPCDVYLDDSPEQIEQLTLNRPDRVVCRYVRPWNHPHPGARDIHDWDEFVALVDRVWC